MLPCLLLLLLLLPLMLLQVLFIDSAIAHYLARGDYLFLCRLSDWLTNRKHTIFVPSRGIAARQQHTSLCVLATVRLLVII